ncbi:MAG: hypothetical protein ABEK84_00315 [Salinibacter sp.]
MSDEPTELAVGESLTVSAGGDLRVETTRSDEYLFTTTYRDAESGTLRLALQVDLTTGSTAVDPRSYDAEFWTLDVAGERRPGTALEEALGRFADPGLEVDTEQRVIHLYEEAD